MANTYLRNSDVIEMVGKSVPSDSYDAVILAVAHNEFLEMDMTSLGKANSVLYDVKGILPKEFIDGRL